MHADYDYPIVSRGDGSGYTLLLCRSVYSAAFDERDWSAIAKVVFMLSQGSEVTVSAFDAAWEIDDPEFVDTQRLHAVDRPIRSMDVITDTGVIRLRDAAAQVDDQGVEMWLRQEADIADE